MRSSTTSRVSVLREMYEETANKAFIDVTASGIAWGAPKVPCTDPGFEGCLPATLEKYLINTFGMSEGFLSKILPRVNYLYANHRDYIFNDSDKTTPSNDSTKYIPTQLRKIIIKFHSTEESIDKLYPKKNVDTQYIKLVCMFAMIKVLGELINRMAAENRSMEDIYTERDKIYSKMESETQRICNKISSAYRAYVYYPRYSGLLDDMCILNMAYINKKVLKEYQKLLRKHEAPEGCTLQIVLPNTDGTYEYVERMINTEVKKDTDDEADVCDDPFLTDDEEVFEKGTIYITCPFLMYYAFSHFMEDTMYTSRLKLVQIRNMLAGDTWGVFNSSVSWNNFCSSIPECYSSKLKEKAVESVHYEILFDIFKKHVSGGVLILPSHDILHSEYLEIICKPEINEKNHKLVTIVSSFVRVLQNMGVPIFYYKGSTSYLDSIRLNLYLQERTADYNKKKTKLGSDLGKCNGVVVDSKFSLLQSKFLTL